MNDSILGFILMVLIIFAADRVFAHPHKIKSVHINSKAAIETIIGEAENQGYKGMLAVAFAIRNRGGLQLAFGGKSKRVREHLYSPTTYHNAELAWNSSSKGIDITHGATGWGNREDLKKFERTKWWKDCEICYTYKDHFFYKRKER